MKKKLGALAGVLYDFVRKHPKTVDYSFTELISETGGSMGIFLGLSLVDVFALLRMLSQASFVRKLVKLIFCLCGIRNFRNQSHQKKKTSSLRKVGKL